MMTNWDNQTRRTFLKSSLAAAAAVATTTEAKMKQPTTRPTWTIACRDAHLDEVGEPDVWSAMKAIDVQGVEVTVDMDGKCPTLFGARQPYTIKDRKGIDQLGEALEQHRVKISAFCLPNRFDERPEEERAYVRMVTDAAVRLKVPAVRVDIVPRKIKDESEFLDFMIGMCRKIIDDSKGTKVHYGVENHGHTTNKPEFLADLFEGIGSDRFGLTLDTGNFYWYGHPLSKLYEIYERFAKRVCHTHAKSINYPESEQEKQRPIGWEYGKYCNPIYDGDIDFIRVAKILSKAGYSNDLCIENEALGRFEKSKRREVLKKEAALLRKIADRVGASASMNDS
jgi:sugar phosphate isomerase/epimerase